MLLPFHKSKRYYIEYRDAYLYLGKYQWTALYDSTLHGTDENIIKYLMQLDLYPYLDTKIVIKNDSQLPAGVKNV